MSKSERVKKLRKELGLTLEKFGNRIGLKNNSVSQIENGVNALTKKTAKLICKEFSVSYTWLVNGEGEMFVKQEKSSLNLLSEEYNLDEADKIVILKYLQLSKNDRKSINNFILGIRDKEKD